MISNKQHFNAVLQALDEQRQRDYEEIERRLGLLNHENARVASVLANSVTREKYEDGQKTDRLAAELAEARLNEKLGLMQTDTNEIKVFLGRVKTLSILGAPLLVIVGGLIQRLIANV